MGSEAALYRQATNPASPHPNLKEEKTMKSFNKRTKQKYIDRAQKHYEQDNIVQGLYWENGKGCCVGCLAEVNDNAHESLQEQTGIPIWLSRVADHIHEVLSEEDSKEWPTIFINAMPINKTEEWFEKNVKAPFLIMVLKSTMETFDHDKFPNVKSAINQAIDLWKRKDIGSKEFLEAAGAAEAAKYKEFSDELIKIMEKA